MAVVTRQLSVFDPRVPVERGKVMFRDLDRKPYAVAADGDDASVAGDSPDGRGAAAATGIWLYAADAPDGLTFNQGEELRPPDSGVLKPSVGSLAWVKLRLGDLAGAPRTRFLEVEFDEDGGAAFEAAAVLCLEDSSGAKASVKLGADKVNPYRIAVPADVGSQAAWDLIAGAWRAGRLVDAAIANGGAAGFDSARQLMDGTARSLDRAGAIRWTVDVPGVGRYWTGNGPFRHDGVDYSGGALEAAAADGEDSARFALHLGTEAERLKWLGRDPGVIEVTLDQLWQAVTGGPWASVQKVRGYLSDSGYEHGRLAVQIVDALTDSDRGSVVYWDNNTQQRAYPGDLGMEYVAPLESEGLPTGWPP